MKNEKKQHFPYASAEIRQHLAERIFGEKETVPADYFETISYFPAMKKMAEEGPSVFGENEGQQVFWYYIMRMRILMIDFSYPRAVDDWGIVAEQLDYLGAFARKFSETHPDERQKILESAIEYEETFPYNPQKGIDARRAKITAMSRQEAAAAFGAPIEELNKMTDEEYRRALRNAAYSQERDIPEKFVNAREYVINSFKAALEQMKSGLSPEEYVRKKRKEMGIAEYSFYMRSPALFPAELFFAEFSLSPDGKGDTYSFRKLFFQNGGMGGTRIEDDKPLPYNADIIWYSIAENKAYSLTADLPNGLLREKLVPDDRKYDGILVELAPYGQASFYVYDTIMDNKEPILKLQAEEISLDLSDFRRAGSMYENSENLAKDWKDYQKKALAFHKEAAEWLSENGLPGKDFDFWKEDL